jgi:cystathionine gamma-synthase
VYLFPIGMSAIWSAHQLILGARQPAKNVFLGIFFRLKVHEDE